MKTLEVALCDSNEDYILKFASYLMNQMEVGMHIFTTPESFYAEEGYFDIAIMSQDFEEIADFRRGKGVGHKYFLVENQDCEEGDYIYRYQAVNRVLDKVIEFKQSRKGNCVSKNKGKSKMIGVYSPVSHELQLPFSMALGQAYRADKKVLFLDLEEISIMPSLVGEAFGKNLMDLLYEINVGTTNLDLNEYVKSFMGFDYIEPFINPTELCEIDRETWGRFFNLLSQTSYDVIIILFGRAINGFANYLEGLDRLFVLGKPGDYFKKGQDAFFDYIARIGADAKVESVILPMSARNLSDNSYQIEELLQGNLGVFVRKLINMNGQCA